MGSLARRSGMFAQGRLLDRLSAKFDDAAQARPLLDEFLRQKKYDRRFCLKLLSVARQRGGVLSWDLRKLAVLMLEHQILKLSANNLPAFDFLLAELGLKKSGLNNPLRGSLLKEGFSTTEFGPFVIEFRQKLARLDLVHRRIRGLKTSESALLEFVEVSRHDSKLSIARYLFTP